MLGLVQTRLHSCAEPNWWIMYGKRAVWYSSFSLVRQKCLVHQKFKLNLGLTQGVPSESDVTLVLLQSRTYSVRFSAWKVWRLNQALVTHCVHKEKYYLCTYQWFAPRIGSFFFKCCNKRYFVPQLWEEIFAQNLIYMYTKMYDYDYVSLHVFASCQPAKSFFNIAKDRKIMCTDRKLVLEFCIRLLVYSKCQIKWNSGPKLQTDRH